MIPQNGETMDDKKDQKEQWDGTYAMAEDFFGNDPSELALSATDLLKKEGCNKILEIGCGQGRDAIFFAGEGFEVWAVDYSQQAILQLAEKAEEEGATMTLGVHDVRRQFPFPDASFDAVYSHMLFTMELTEEEVSFALDECLRILKPGGLNIYSVRNDNDPHYGKFLEVGEDMWQNPMGFVVHFFTEEKVRRLAEGYQVERIVEFEDTSPPFVKKLYEVVLRKPVAD